MNCRSAFVSLPNYLAMRLQLRPGVSFFINDIHNYMSALDTYLNIIGNI
jgi:hypothetical protein